MKLYLVQHGDAVAKDVDPDRPLSNAGRADVERMAAFLSRHEPALVTIAHSGKTRAQQTAEILASKLGCENVAEAVTGLAPLDPTEPWVKKVGGWEQDTMLVGHLPFMGKLVSQLVRGNNASVVDYQPGTIVCLEPDGQSGWWLTWMLRPELIQD